MQDREEQKRAGAVQDGGREQGRSEKRMASAGQVRTMEGGHRRAAQRRRAGAGQEGVSCAAGGQCLVSGGNGKLDDDDTRTHTHT